MKKFPIISRFVILLFAVWVSGAVSAQTLQYWRPSDQSGVNEFETPKKDTVGFDGLKVRIGGNFALQYQMLRASNNPSPLEPADSIVSIGNGFNLATANLNIDAQLADGVRLRLTTYLSSRHHEDTWVKGGYIQFDKLAFLHNDMINSLMKHVTLKIGHMEINYGDAHFRRTDNGNALYNPFVGNLIMDAFATEIGGEVYYQKSNIISMLGIANAQLKDDITKVGRRSPGFYGKLGYDSQVSSAVRLRLTGSFYYTNSLSGISIYGGDRTGSRYYLVLTNSTDFTFPHTTGRWNPGFSKTTNFVLNPFIKIRGLELFGNFETATGRSAKETADRTVNQVAVDGVYRFLAGENLFIGARYDKVSGALEPGMTGESIKRVQVGGGWFMTKNILVKAEYVNQHYNGFADNSIYHEGEFHGGMLEAVIGF